MITAHNTLVQLCPGSIGEDLNATDVFFLIYNGVRFTVLVFRTRGFLRGSALAHDCAVRMPPPVPHRVDCRLFDAHFKKVRLSLTSVMSRPDSGLTATSLVDSRDTYTLGHYCTAPGDQRQSRVGVPEQRRAHTAEAECSPSEMTRRTLTVAQVVTSDFTDGPEQPTEEEGLDPASRFPMRTAQRVKRLWCKADIISYTVLAGHGGL